MNDVADQLRKKGITVHAMTRNGPVVKVILDTAVKEKTDLIAMASHGRSGLGRVFYGSVAAGVVQHIDRPLLIIRSRDREWHWIWAGLKGGGGAQVVAPLPSCSITER